MNNSFRKYLILVIGLSGILLLVIVFNLTHHSSSSIEYIGEYIDPFLKVKKGDGISYLQDLLKKQDLDQKEFKTGEDKELLEFYNTLREKSRTTVKDNGTWLYGKCSRPYEIILGQPEPLKGYLCPIDSLPKITAKAIAFYSQTNFPEYRSHQPTVWYTNLDAVVFESSDGTIEYIFKGFNPYPECPNSSEWSWSAKDIEKRQQKHDYYCAEFRKR
jgi:hypothetical protein